MNLKKQEFKRFRTSMKEALAVQFGSGNIATFWGDQDAKIVSISQVPSISALKEQKPFSDKSGEKLRKIWYQVSDGVFYNPSNFYFTVVGMYFPGKGKNGDLKPSLDIARKWLRKELSFLNPNLFLVINGKKTFVLPHPSPLNIRWFQEHPEFKTKRLEEIGKDIHTVLFEK